MGPWGGLVDRLGPAVIATMALLFALVAASESLFQQKQLWLAVLVQTCSLDCNKFAERLNFWLCSLCVSCLFAFASCAVWESRLVLQSSCGQESCPKHPEPCRELP